MLSTSKKPLVAALLALALALPGGVALAAPSPEAAVRTDGVVNINDATPAQLAYLPGIGPAKAERIVAYRAKHRFKTPLELARVRGIGLKTVHKLKAWLRVDGPTTLDGPVRSSKRPKGDGETS
ncbi:MAG: helix-hairpin-helix domain-containing protein [Deltaproteobacteria bacterium]|nr:MAG: helix-hairpin-helix domain-containing protein [Deltaproteobacteria bacterium]